MSSPVTTVIGLVAVIFAGTGMRDPVTVTSCSVPSGAAAAAGACCAAAGVDRAAAHVHIDKVITNRFTSDPTPISFRILILVFLEVSYVWRRVFPREDPCCVVAT